MEVAGDAVGGAVHVHRRDHHAVAQGQSAQPERREHRGCAGRAAEVTLDGVGEGRVAQPQIVVGDPATAGEQVEGELPGRLLEVGGELLEPAEAGGGRALGGLDDRAALGLVRGECLAEGRLFLDAGGECERVLDGELGTGADGEVGGVGGVAEQHRIAVGPAVVDDGTEGDPGGVVAAEGRPPRASAKILAHWSVDCSSSQASRPAARQTSSRISMMTVLVPSWLCGAECFVVGWSSGDGRAKG